MSPFGATATCRAGPPTSAITFAQKPCGRVSPPLPGSQRLAVAFCCAERLAAAQSNKAVMSLRIDRMINPKSQTPNPNPKVQSLHIVPLIVANDGAHESEFI